MSSNPVTALKDQFKRALIRAWIGSLLWSTAHHGSGILSIVASGGAAFIAASHKDGLTAVETTQIAAMSGVAAMLTAISAFAGCSKKWRVNRETRLSLQLLKLHWRDDDFDKLRDQFAHIMKVHERGIAGAEPA